MNPYKTSSSRVTRSPSPRFKLHVPYESSDSEPSHTSPPISLTQSAINDVKQDVAQLKNSLIAAPKRSIHHEEVLSMGREVRNFTRVVKGLTARLRESRVTEERLRNRIRFLENKCEEEGLIRDSILSSKEKDLSSFSNIYNEYAPRSFSSNFISRNNRR